ncbi:MAG: hypothetical protein HY422_02585 [Candidatus Komeilibacteria bacterium]|nr:hypothetical protein [Candidatus Komeilibacteria bacterium]
MLQQTTQKTVPYWIIGLFFLLAINVGFLILFVRTPQGHRYTGIGLESTGDKLVYYSMLRQGMQGDLFMRNTQTSEPQRALLFSPHWWLIGGTAAMTRIPMEAAYHIYRIIFAALFVWILYRIVRELPMTPAYRIVTYASVLFGSGFGWFYMQLHPQDSNPIIHWMYYFQNTPADIYVTEMNTFTSFVQSPLFMLSYILLLACLYVLMRALRRPSHRTDVLLGVLSFLLIIIHPYDAMVLLGVICSFIVWRIVTARQQALIRTGLYAFGGSMLAYAYTWWSFQSEPALKGWLEQNITYSPRAGMYMWSLGIFFVLWLIGMYRVFAAREKDPWIVLMAIWSVLVWVLLYLPLPINRRLSNAWFVPIAIIGVYGLYAYLKNVRSFVMRSAIISIIIMCGLSGTLWRLIIYATYTPTLTEKYAYYLDPYIDTVLTTVNRSFTQRDVVLSNEPVISMLSGAYSPARIYVGHGHQTVNFLSKQQSAQWFFGTNSGPKAQADKEAFIRSSGITALIVYRPSLTTDVSWLASAVFLQRIYSNEAADVYRVL